MERWEKDIAPSIGGTIGPALLFAVVGKDGRTPLGPSSLNLFDPNGLDNINIDLLRLLWESLLCDVLPAVIDQGELPDKLTISLYGATRQRATPLPDSDLNGALASAEHTVELLKSKWGIERSGLDSSVKDRNGFEINTRNVKEFILKPSVRTAPPPFLLLWSSLRADSFWPIVADAVYARQGAPGFSLVTEAIVKAVGVMLAYNVVTKDGRLIIVEKTSARHLHYIADVLAGLWNDSHISDVRPTLRMLTETGFDEPNRKAIMSVRARLIMLSKAHRLMDHQHCLPEALALFDALPDHPDDLVFLVLAERLRKRLHELTGADYVRLCSLLENQPTWFSENRLQTPDRIPLDSAQKKYI